MKKVGTKTVRKIAQGLGIYTGYSWTEKPYVNKNERYVVFGGGSEQQAIDLATALSQLGYHGSIVRFVDKYNSYIRIAKCVIEK